MDNRLIASSRDVTLINELGLHARAAAMIAKLAQTARSKVWIIKDGEEVDASSVIDILTLACAKDSNVQLRIDLVESGFGE